jgi:hypothetical protein
VFDEALYRKLLNRLTRQVGADACWLWSGAVSPGGYGQIYHNGKNQRAHRLMWSSRHGQIPGKMVVCHRCDNPLCARPDHLFLGTLAENNADRHAKGRTVAGGRRPRITAHWNAGLDFAQVWEDQCAPDDHDFRALGQ